MSDKLSREKEDFIEKLQKENDIITLKSVYGKTGAKATAFPSRTERGSYLGLKEDKKNKIVVDEKTSVELYDGMEFNMKEPQDAAYWDMVKYSAFVAYSEEEAQYEPDAMFFVYVPDRIAKNEVSKEKEIHRAKGNILEDGLEGLVARSKAIGVDMSGDSIEVIQKVLLDMAKVDPQKINRLYSNDFASTLIFHKAVAKGIMTKNNDGVYTYMGTLIGNEDDVVIEYISKKENEEMLDDLRSRLGEIPKVKFNPVGKSEEELVKYIKEHKKFDGSDLESLKYNELQALAGRLNKM